MINCADIRSALDLLHECKSTDDGLRLSTTCLYPSFDVVYVYVSKFGDGYQVTDGGGASTSAWQHGRDDQLISREINKIAQRFKLKAAGGVLSAEAISIDWLPSAILGVANASSMAANSAVDHIVAAAEEALSDKIYAALASVYPVSRIGRETEFGGKSGKAHKFDFVLTGQNKILLVDAVSPHHVSIASKYVSFADVKASNELVHGFAVYDKQLDADDASLMQQVADLVPLTAVSKGAKRLVA